jgi:hypothetical protein
MLTGHAGVSPAVDRYLFFLTIKNPNYGNYQTRCAGGFSGKVGAVIGSSWKGIAVMRGPTGSIAIFTDKLRYVRL